MFVGVTRDIVPVPILRAGLGFLDGFLDLIPQASVSHVGLARNEQTLAHESFFFKYPPDLAEPEIMVLDPMLATAGSPIEAVCHLTQAGATRIRFVHLVAAECGNLTTC